MSAPDESQAASGRAITRPIFIARALREFADGFVVVLLPVYLTALGLDAFEVGVVATMALLGSALMTLGVGMLGSGMQQRRLLIAAALLATGTGLAFAAARTTSFVYLIAFFGTINPSSGSVSIFAPLEQSALSGAVADRERTAMFARYGLIGSLAAAVGSLSAGSPDLLARAGMDRTDALRAMFLLYAAFGLLAAVMYARLPISTARSPASRATPLGPSKWIVYRLAALFSLDSFGGGFAVQSLLALWLFNKFGLSLTAAGAIFFWTGVLSAFSYPVAAWLSQRIGLVNTMVFTHIPANLALILAAIVPSFEIAIALLLVRAALSQMDVPARTSYVMAVVTPPERAAAASITSVPRSLATAASPALAGAMFAAGYEWLPLVLCGVIKIVYDLALLHLFRNVRPPEERA